MTAVERLSQNYHTRVESDWSSCFTLSYDA